MGVCIADMDMPKSCCSCHMKKWISVERAMPLFHGSRTEDVAFKSKSGTLYVGHAVLGTMTDSSEIVCKWFAYGAGLVNDVDCWFPLPDWNAVYRVEKDEKHALWVNGKLFGEKQRGKLTWFCSNCGSIRQEQNQEKCYSCGAIMDLPSDE